MFRSGSEISSWTARAATSAPAQRNGGGRDRGLRYFSAMNPARKRTVRLVVALSAAVILASALIYTSFSAASPALSPSQLARQAQPGRSYEVTGTVAQGSVHRGGAVLYFSVEDRTGGTTIPLAYTGTVPDPFREGREVIVTVEKQGSRYVGERNSLITKCPSKYKTAPAGEKQNY
jgi:cytochrome c-type biogenesis protein CcmE